MFITQKFSAHFRSWTQILYCIRTIFLSDRIWHMYAVTPVVCSYSSGSFVLFSWKCHLKWLSLFCLLICEHLSQCWESCHFVFLVSLLPYLKLLKIAAFSLNGLADPHLLYDGELHTTIDIYTSHTSPLHLSLGMVVIPQIALWWWAFSDTAYTGWQECPILYWELR